jgi:uncharacterized protein with gpF-like domain
VPRRLVRDVERDRAEQERLQTRISAVGQKAVRQEIARASERMLLAWQATGEIADDPEHYRTMRGLIDRLHAIAIRAFAARMEEQIKAASPRELKASGNDLYDRLIQEYLQSEGGALIADDISETTKRLIVRQIRAGQRDGLSNAEIVASIRARIGAISLARAAIITRTEVHNAAMFALFETAKETGVVTRKEWVAAMDDRTRDDPFSHVDANGQVVLLDEPFDVSGEALMYPGDTSGSAGNVINCRCALVFLVDD